MPRTCSIPLTSDFRYSDAAERVVQRGVLVQGPETDAFEEEFARWLWGNLDPRRVVAVSSGTDALTALLMAHGIRDGDLVAVPAVTFTATALSVVAAGATPVFVDVDSTWNLSPAALEEWKDGLAAVVAVDLHGVPADFRGIERVMGTKTPIIEDACPAYGARSQAPGPHFEGRGSAPAGLLGRSGAAFSLNESKQLPAGEGGVVVAPDVATADRVREMRHFGHDPGGERERDGLLRASLLGSNWKITEFAAAFGRAGLDGLSNRVMASRLNGEIIRSAATDSPLLSAPPTTIGSEPSWFKIRVSAPNDVLAAAAATWLEERGVPISRDEVAPLPEHLAFVGFPGGPWPNALELHRSFCIGDRANPVFGIETSTAERWAEVVRCIPSKLVSP